MDKLRMETFSDAVLAILLTILVLELSIPQTADLNGLFQMKEQFLAYGISFFILATYWINHHHLLDLADKINEQVIWANILGLFSISLFPFVTAWFGKSDFNSLVPAMLYGIVFLTTNAAYAFLQYSLIKCNGESSKIYKTLSGDRRILITFAISIISIFLAFISPILTPITCFLITAMFVIPTKTIENFFKN
ncbi:TMEM175 family protein [uncultured Methanobacterium sp.]|uniref:TMEM175 family protein n=1 Tax=uncultured Methanobacterium sp. TaxID=176306 RepID=UPI002AA69BCC|nr:TMEM175 family protein [uncultured Methanobacterium sp.]